MNITQAETITAKCKKLVVNHSDAIELGSGKLEKMLLGETFQKWFNNHQHIGNMGAPTSPPMLPSLPTHLSQKNVKNV